MRNENLIEGRYISVGTLVKYNYIITHGYLRSLAGVLACQIDGSLYKYPETLDRWLPDFIEKNLNAHNSFRARCLFFRHYNVMRWGLMLGWSTRQVGLITDASYDEPPWLAQEQTFTVAIVQPIGDSTQYRKPVAVEDWDYKD